MSRKVFDLLTSVAGIAVVVTLVIAGGLLTWGHSFVNSNVRTQLAQQQVYFPPQAAFAHPKAGTEITPSMIGPVSQFAGQQLLPGEQAKVYANDFIAVHLSEMPYGGVYSKASGAALKDPTNTKLQGVVQTIFRGTTLRASCSRPTRSRPSARSCCGARSHRSPSPPSSRCWWGWASGTPAARPKRSRCWSRRRSPLPPDRLPRKRLAPAGPPRADAHAGLPAWASLVLRRSNLCQALTQKVRASVRGMRHSLPGWARSRIAGVRSSA
jgi:hypothetical protein